MSSDIVKRLRELETKLPTASDSWIEARELQLEAAARIEALEKALRSACGYMRNAQIDLDTGAPKKTALATITSGLKLTEAALAALPETKP